MEHGPLRQECLKGCRSELGAAVGPEHLRGPSYTEDAAKFSDECRGGGVLANRPDGEPAGERVDRHQEVAAGMLAEVGAEVLEGAAGRLVTAQRFLWQRWELPLTGLAVSRDVVDVVSQVWPEYDLSGSLFRFFLTYVASVEVREYAGTEGSRYDDPAPINDQAVFDRQLIVHGPVGTDNFR